MEAALNHINMKARVVLCGGISAYNATEPVPGPSNLMNLVVMRARMEGFIILDYMDKASIAVGELLGWVKEDKLKFQIDLQEGFENIPDTLNRLFTGKNIGKQLLKIADQASLYGDRFRRFVSERKATFEIQQGVFLRCF